MSRSLIVLPSAISDIEAVSLLFTSDANPRVSERFEENLETCFSRLIEFPRMGAELFWRMEAIRPLRFVLVPEFPNYIVYYRESPESVDIVRVMHGSREAPWDSTL